MLKRAEKPTTANNLQETQLQHFVFLLAHNNQTNVSGEGAFRCIAFSVEPFTDFLSKVVAFKS